MEHIGATLMYPRNISVSDGKSKKGWMMCLMYLCLKAEVLYLFHLSNSFIPEQFIHSLFSSDRKHPLSEPPVLSLK